VEHGKPVALSIVAGNLSGLGMTLDGLTADVSRPRLEPTGASDTSNPVSLSALIGIDRLTLPEGVSLPLDRTVAAAHLALRVRGALPAGPPIPALTAWRDGGGTIEIDSLDLDWPPAAAVGNATIALDGALQPELAGTVKLRGASEVIDRAAAQRMMDRDAAKISKLALRLASKPTSNGESETKMAIGVQNRVLSVGPVPLLQVPEIEW
jgi:hypothetical protein